MTTNVDRISNELIMKIRVLRANHPSLRGASYLKVAVWRGNSEIADILLDKEPNYEWGTSLEQRNDLLIELIKKNKQESSLSEFITKLINKHALDVEIDRENGSGRTALNVAIAHDDKVTAELLLANRANVNYLQTSGCLSPLMDAIFDKTGDEYYNSMAFLLIKYGADLTYETSNGMTVLDACTHVARLDVMNRVIAENPMDIDAFRKALRIAYIQSQVPTSHLGELVLPRDMERHNISPTVAPLRIAIQRAMAHHMR